MVVHGGSGRVNVLAVTISVVVSRARLHVRRQRLDGLVLHRMVELGVEGVLAS